MKKMKKAIQKTAAIFTVAALTIGMVPVQSIDTYAATAKGSYEVVVAPTMDYDMVYGFEGGLSRVEADDKCGAIDITGKEIIPCEYVSLIFINEEKMICTQDTASNWYMFDWNGNLLYTYGEYYDMDIIDNVLYCYDSNYEVVKKVNFDGSAVIEEEIPFDVSSYVECEKLSEGDRYIAYVLDENTYSLSSFLLDSTGKVIKDMGAYYWIDCSPVGLLYGLKSGESEDEFYVAVTDLDGNEIANTEDGTYTEFLFGFWEEYLLAKDASDNWYVLDKKGNELSVLGKYTELNYLDAQKLIGKNADEEYVVLDMEGNVITRLGKYDYVTAISSDLIGAQNYGPDYETDAQDTEIFLMKSDGTSVADDIEVWHVTNMTDGVVVYDMNWKWGLYDNAGNYITPLDNQIQDFGDYCEGYLPVMINGKWGIYKINETKPSNTQQNNNQQNNNQQNNNQQNNTQNNNNQQTNNQQSSSTGQSQVTSTGTNKVSAPAKAKIKKVKKGKKKAIVTLARVKGAKGYKIQYSTKKNFKSAKNVLTTKLKTTVKKLKSGKTYYFRVKAYKLNGKKKVYSKKWSKVVKSKIK